MDSLAAASEILTQLKQLTDGMASIRQDVDALKLESSHQRRPPGEEADNDGDDTTAQLPGQLLATHDSGRTGQEPAACNQGSSWAEEMDSVDPLLDNDEPTPEAARVKVVPVMDRTNKFLTEAFSRRISGAGRRALHSHYTLPQNELTRAPFLDTMMASECSRQTKSTDRSLYTLQGFPRTTEPAPGGSE